MTDNPLSGIIADPEAPCAECLSAGGFCHSCLEHLAPKLAINGGWLKMIGETYTCDGKTCGQGEHLVCLDKPGASTPRAGCDCHSCVQRRKAIEAQRIAAAEADKPVARKELVAVEAAKRRNSRKFNRIARLTSGQFSPARPKRAAA